MGSDKGVLARAIAGGFKGGTAALRQEDELTEKFLWGNEEARQTRQTNLERFGQQKQLATHTAGLAVSGAQTTRRQKKEEGISAVQQGLKAKMEAMDTDPKTIDEAVQLAGAGLSAAIIQGTPGKPLTAEAIKQVAEAVDKLMPDGTPEEKLAAAGQLEAKITAGTYGIQRAAASAKEQMAFDKAATAKEGVLTAATDKFMEVLTSDPAKAVSQFETIVTGDPTRAADLLGKIEATGTVYGPTLKHLKRLLSKAAKQQKIGKPTEPVGVLPLATTSTPEQTKVINRRDFSPGL